MSPWKNEFILKFSKRDSHGPIIWQDDDCVSNALFTDKRKTAYVTLLAAAREPEVRQNLPYDTV
jgi:hypothetical protein